MKPSDDDQPTPPEQWALNVHNDTGSRSIMVESFSNSAERKIPVVSLAISRTGKAREMFGAKTVVSHLTPDEADALATLLMYQAQLVREKEF